MLGLGPGFCPQLVLNYKHILHILVEVKLAYIKLIKTNVVKSLLN